MAEELNIPQAEGMPEIRTVEVSDIVDTVLMEDRVSLHGVYKYEPNLGDFVENSLIPAVYERYRKKQENLNRLIKDGTKVYYPSGLDNQYPLFLLDLQSKSGTLSTCIDTVAKSARGMGLTVLSENAGLKADFEDWLRTVGINSEFERLLFQNLATTRGAYIEISTGSDLNEDGQVQKKVNSFRAVNFIKYRVGRENEVGEIEHYWYHPNYYTRRIDTRKLRGVAKYKNPKDALDRHKANTVVQKDKETPYYETPATKPFNLGRFVHYLKDPSLLSEHYANPTYATESVINAIILDAAISSIDIASVENGLSVAYFVTVPLMKPREDNVAEMEKYEQRKAKYLDYVKTHLQGAENTDNVVVMFSDPRRNHQPIEVAEVPNNNTAEVLTSKASRKNRTIYTAFHVTNPALIGSPPESGKGLNNQKGLLAEADDLFYGSFVHDFTELAEEFFRDVVLPLYAASKGIGLDALQDLRVIFPRKHRFNTMPPTEVLLQVVTTSKIYELFNLGEYDEETRTELIRDLQDRAAGKTQAAGHSGEQSNEEEPEEDEEPEEENED